MKSFAFVVIGMIGLVAIAVGLSAPIDGYEVMNVSWCPDIPGITSLNLTGTVQEVWAYITITWPGYQLPKKDLAGRQGPIGPPFPSPEDPHNLTDGYLNFRDIANAASDIDLTCIYPVAERLPPDYSLWTSGQIFFPDKWNVIVMEDSDHC
ncbi:hypothetical protein UCDDA912_g02546 [Diaporthe ampelina]|uniref:Uncharacterized protein n=1 Tax=Diaporthe ampelina TaxID=1214573 RepID=A0A0G2FU21_9PEZI|nr:hypothetical protein UCDDA912_g02546 [Diaporthe ampelina]